MRKYKYLLAFVGLLAFVSGINNVYAYYTVKFYNAEGEELLKTCTTDDSNRITSECTSVLAKICAAWDENKCRRYYQNGSGMVTDCNTQDQNTPYSASYFLNSVTFSANKTFYCHGQSSVHSPEPNIGCYVCNSNANIMKWDTDGNADDKCSSYTKTSKSEDECNRACYVCKNDSSIVKWDVNGNNDSNCTGGYNKDTTKNQSQCKPAATPTPSPTPTPTPTPTSACYVCQADSSVVKWSTNGNGDTKCAGGYTKDTTKNQSQCKPAEQPKEACYVCKADSNYFKWKTTSDGDDGCRGGYNKTTLSKDNCIANPKTGHITAVVVLLIEIAAFFIIFSYVSDVIFKKKKNNS